MRKASQNREISVDFCIGSEVILSKKAQVRPVHKVKQKLRHFLLPNALAFEENQEEARRARVGARGGRRGGFPEIGAKRDEEGQEIKVEDEDQGLEEGPREFEHKDRDPEGINYGCEAL